MERPEIGVRLAHAFHSSDLSHKPGACDVDKLAAIGMVTAREPLQAELMRLRFDNDPKAYRPALNLLVRRVWQICQKADWQASTVHCELLARNVLDYWIAPQCRACNGLGFKKQPDAPTLEARPCPVCRSSGLAQPRLHRKLRADKWQGRFNLIYGWLYGQENVAAGRVAAKLRNRQR